MINATGFTIAEVVASCTPKVTAAIKAAAPIAPNTAMILAGCVARMAVETHQTTSIDRVAPSRPSHPISIAPAISRMAMKSASRTHAAADGPRHQNSTANPTA